MLEGLDGSGKATQAGLVEGSAEEVQNVENEEVADVQVEAEPQLQTTAEAVQQSFFQ